MSDLANRLLTGYREWYTGVVAKTVSALGEAELTFTTVHDDFLTIRGEILTAYPPEVVGNSLLFAFAGSIPKRLYDLQADFLHARYDETGREFRFLWEMTFRARRDDADRAGEGWRRKPFGWPVRSGRSIGRRRSPRVSSECSPPPGVGTSRAISKRSGTA